MIFIFKYDFFFRPYPAVPKHTNVFPFQNSIMSWSKQRATPSSYIRVSLISGQAKKRSEQCLWTNWSISREKAGRSELHRAEQTIDWLCFSTSKHLRCQLHRWLWALNAHIWLLQLEVSLLLKPAVAYSHSLVCLPIQNPNAEWFIVDAIRCNLCGHVDSGKPLCWKYLE